MKNIMYLIFIVLYGCSLSVETDVDKKLDSANTETKLPNDIRWITNSSEYKILCEQTYKNAWDNLSEVLKNANSQSAIIMDLDETILDNSDYQVGLTEKNESYKPESWFVWVNQEEAKLVPGAKAFIDSVRTTKTRLIFLSNRMAKNELPTINNMKQLSIYEEDDIFLLRIDKPDKKHIRRAEVIDGTGRIKDIGPLTVLAYFGDARHDFPDPDDYYSFGKNMFMFPNPMYGKW
ncbi:MAG: HAD family acid phosphatase [Candidatus Neomarinimicrobiota bacterium]